MTSFTIELAFPPSLNDYWKPKRHHESGKAQFYSSRAKKAFERKAGMQYLLQKRGLERVTGAFRYHVTLNSEHRNALADGDNVSSKAILDFLQYVRLIENDKLAEGGSWEWGVCAGGCRVRVWSVESTVSNRVPETLEAAGS